MNDPQPFDIRRRIRELLAIPDRDRTDEQWDELNELEIRTAPGNRDTGYSSDRNEGKRQGGFGQGRRPNHGKKTGGGQRAEPRLPQPPQESRAEGARPDGQNRPPKRQHRRPKRTSIESPGGTGNAGNPENGGTEGNS